MKKRILIALVFALLVLMSLFPSPAWSSVLKESTQSIGASAGLYQTFPDHGYGAVVYVEPWSKTYKSLDRGQGEERLACVQIRLYYLDGGREFFRGTTGPQHAGLALRSGQFETPHVLLLGASLDGIVQVHDEAGIVYPVSIDLTWNRDGPREDTASRNLGQRSQGRFIESRTCSERSASIMGTLTIQGLPEIGTVTVNASDCYFTWGLLQFESWSRLSVYE